MSLPFLNQTLHYKVLGVFEYAYIW